MSALRRLAEEVRGCERCPRLVRCRSRAVPGVGPARARVMFVGLAPGRCGADRTGIPFTRDASGRLFRRALEACGVDAREVFVTNVVKCNPNDGRRNLAPTQEEIANCLAHLRREVALVRPARIVALGRVAARVLRDAFPDRDVRAIPHPGYAARHTRRYGELDFVTDLGSAVRR